MLIITLIYIYNQRKDIEEFSDVFLQKTKDSVFVKAYLQSEEEEEIARLVKLKGKSNDQLYRHLLLNEIKKSGNRDHYSLLKERNLSQKKVIKYRDKIRKEIEWM